MRKYLFIIKTQIMSNLQYIFNVFVGFIGYFIMLFIFFNLWKYLYSDPNEIINGYSMPQMMWYVIITEVLYMTLNGRVFCQKICNDVKSGNITYSLNKPYSYIAYCLCSNLGDIFLKGIIYFILGIVVGLLFMGSFPNISVLEFVLMFITSIFALVISTLLITSIGLLSFFIEDAGPFYWIYSKFILVLGTMFPIEYFPLFVQKILVYSPIYVVSYGPAKLFVDFSINNFIGIICAQIIYIGISYLLCSWIYRNGVKKINVNGG